MTTFRRAGLSALLLAALLAAQLIGLMAASPARAASILWTLTASPLAATTGVQRVFTLTATNEDPLAALLSSSEIGCVVVDVPSNFTVAGAAVTGSNTGDRWHVHSVVGNRVTVHTDSGGDRLALLDWVRFTITATPFKTGSLTWNARAFRQQDCTGSAALLGVPPVVVVTDPLVTPTPVPTPTPKPTPTPTPTPKPTPTPTPKPTPSPTPTPTPTPLLPLPSLPLPPLPLPSSSDEPTPTPAPSQPSRSTPTPSPEPSASGEVPAPTPGGESSPTNPGDGGPPSGTGGSVGTGGEAPVAPLFAPDGPRIGGNDAGQLEVGTVGTGFGSGLGVWSVPAATLGVPGILLIVWVALQAIGALAWIPAVRRLRGDEAQAA